MLMQSNALLKPRIIDVQSTSPVQARVTMRTVSNAVLVTAGECAGASSCRRSRPRADRSDDRRGASRYSTLDGVRGDIVDLPLNLKGVVFKLNGRSGSPFVSPRPAKAG